MSVHIHTIRNYCASALALVPAPLLLGWVLAPESKNTELAQVSGRVTCSGKPISGIIHFVPDHGSGPYSMGLVDADGSFQLYVNGQQDRRGAVPGKYRIIVNPRVPDKTGSRVALKYRDTRTTDLLVDVAPDWNDVRLNLR
jgi:hypothetical protein